MRKDDRLENMMRQLALRASMGVNEEHFRIQSECYKLINKLKEAIAEIGENQLNNYEDDAFRWVPDTFKNKLLRKTVRNKIKEFNTSMVRYVQGFVDQNYIEELASWFILHNISVKYIPYEGLKIVDDDILDRFLPLDDEALLDALNEFYLEHKYEFSSLQEKSPIKRKVKMMKGALESKGYTVKIDDLYHIAGVE